MPFSHSLIGVSFVFFFGCFFFGGSLTDACFFGDCFASLPAVEEETMEATVKCECLLGAHEMMVMENVLVKLAKTVLSIAMVAEMPTLMSDH